MFFSSSFRLSFSFFCFVLVLVTILLLLLAHFPAKGRGGRRRRRTRTNHNKKKQTRVKSNSRRPRFFLPDPSSMLLRQLDPVRTLTSLPTRGGGFGTGEEESGERKWGASVHLLPALLPIFPVSVCGACQVLSLISVPQSAAFFWVDAPVCLGWGEDRWSSRWWCGGGGSERVCVCELRVLDAHPSGRARMLLHQTARAHTHSLETPLSHLPSTALPTSLPMFFLYLRGHLFLLTLRNGDKGNERKRGQKPLFDLCFSFNFFSRRCGRSS